MVKKGAYFIICRVRRGAVYPLVKLAVDAMGGDHAPQEIVRGAVAALQARKDLKLLLVGRRDQVEEALSGLTYPPGQLSLIHADEVIGGSDNPGLAIRRKRKSSMVTALQLVRSGRADAVLSAGNTGALMAGALLFLGRLPKGGPACPAYGDAGLYRRPVCCSRCWRQYGCPARTAGSVCLYGPDLCAEIAKLPLAARSPAQCGHGAE